MPTLPHLRPNGSAGQYLLSAEIRQPFFPLWKVTGRLRSGPDAYWFERRTEERTETQKAEQRAGEMAINRTEYRRSVHATIDGRGSRRGTTDRFVSPGGATLLLTTNPAPGHLAKQRPHRAQKRPAEHARGFSPSTGLTPGMPQSGPDPPPCHDIIGSTLSFHG